MPSYKQLRTKTTQTVKTLKSIKTNYETWTFILKTTKKYWMYTSKNICFNIKQKKQKQNQNAHSVWLIEQILIK